MSDETKATLVSFADWFSVRIAEFHACTTGDCPHSRRSECAEAAVAEFEEFCLSGDAEPVTAEWLESVGFGYHKGLGLWFIRGVWFDLSTFEARINRVLPRQFKTRGDLRLLCKALGIELKEGE